MSGNMYIAKKEIFLGTLAILILLIFFTGLTKKKDCKGIEVSLELEISSPAKIASGTLFEIRDPNGNILASAGYPKIWNSYRSNSENSLHFFVRNTQKAVLEKLPSPNPHMRTAYLLGENGEIFVSDMYTGDTYHITALAGGKIQYKQVAMKDVVTYLYKSPDFNLSMTNSQIEACNNENNCKKIAIHSGTWPYVFAEHNGSVITVTNYGDVLIFRRNKWCRAYRDGKRYQCDPENPRADEIVIEPKGFQFYTSVDYKDKTFLGEWPTGVLYEFNGEVLEPSSLSPSFFEIQNEIGYEAQSSAIYGGDLYVGYWPKGELYQRDEATGRWKKFKRLFSHPESSKGKTFIPYYDHSYDGIVSAFFGQRVSSMEIVGSYLYISTSNLRGWHKGINPTFLSTEQINEYGAIYRLKRNGCLTAFIPLHKMKKFNLKFVAKNDSISVYSDGQLIGSAKSDTILSDKVTRLTYKLGIFGPLKGIKILEKRVQKL